MTTRPQVIDHDHGRFTVTEELTRSAPLGLRVLSSVDGQVVTGLSVSAWPDPALTPGPTIIRKAYESSGGVHGFASLPTTTRAEQGSVGDFGATRPYFVRIADPQRRWLPQLLELDVPAAGIQEVFAFPAPTYVPPLGFVVMRASVRHEISTAGPAATALAGASWAALSLAVPGLAAPVIGIADQAGEALLAVPYPTTTAGTSLNDQRVTAALAIKFDPELEVDAVTGIPLLSAVFDQPDIDFDGDTTVPVELIYGAEAVAENDARSLLLLVAA